MQSVFSNKFQGQACRQTGSISNVNLKRNECVLRKFSSLGGTKSIKLTLKVFKWQAMDTNHLEAKKDVDVLLFTFETVVLLLIIKCV